jgi:hypothetical protein
VGNYQTIKHIKTVSRRIEKEVLVDICQIYPAVITGTISDEGILQKDASVARQYNGSEDIPCRIDLSRSFRPEKHKVQPTVADEYNSEFPRDLQVKTSDRVFVTDAWGVVHEFRIRKLKAISNMDATREALIEEVENVTG